MQSVKFARGIALTDTQIKASAGPDIDARRVFCYPDRMLKRHQQNIGPDPNTARSRGNGCGGRQDGRIIAIFSEMVFRQPDVVIA